MFGSSAIETIHQGFLDRVRDCPEHIALEYAEGTMSYAALFAAARDLAAIMDARIDPTNRRPIAVYGAKSHKSIIGMLAALMTGRGITYLCPRQRAARIAAMIEQLRPALILDLGSPEWDHDPSAIAHGSPVVLYPERLPISCFEPIADPYGAAYVYFTSGSTGVPKGAVVSHQAALTAQRAFIADIGLTSADRLCTEMAFNYDVSTIDIFSGLAVGATLDITPEPVVDDPALLFSHIVEKKLTYLFTCPTVARMVLEVEPQAAEKLSTVKLSLTGEMIPDRLADLMEPLIRRGNVYNQYGATEFPFGLSAKLQLSDIPAPNRVLRSQEGVPVRERLSDTGEIVLTGKGLFSGYVTPDFDFASPLQPVSSFATADRVEPTSDRDLRILGRMDRQCRMGGYRIELRELECAAEKHPDVELAYAIYNQQANCLEVHITLKNSDFGMETAVLQTFMRRLLPDYMVPEKVVVLDEAPRSLGGKKLYKALQATAEKSI
jgi:acyl-coenzyme A synthetase/AMP-(fatty) acid ligase